MKKNRFNNGDIVVIKKKDRSVEEYRKRRDKRLKKRMDADVEWITVNGAHVPIEDGIVKSGPLKGKELSRAKTEEAGKKYGSRRGQIDTGIKGFVKGGDLDAYNGNALKSIMEETGYDEKQAKELQNSLNEYLGGDFKAFTRGERKEDEKVIDEEVNENYL